MPVSVIGAPASLSVAWSNIDQERGGCGSKICSQYLSLLSQKKTTNGPTGVCDQLKGASLSLWLDPTLIKSRREGGGWFVSWGGSRPSHCFIREFLGGNFWEEVLMLVFLLEYSVTEKGAPRKRVFLGNQDSDYLESGSGDSTCFKCRR